MAQTTGPTAPNKPSPIIYVVLLAPLATTLPFSFAFESFMHAKDVALMGIFLLTIWHFLKPDPGLPIPRIVALLLVLLVLPLSWMWGNDIAVPTGTIRQIAHHLILVITALMLWDIAQRHELTHRIPEAIIIAATGAAALGILQFAGLIDFLLPPVEGYDQRMYSVFGNHDLIGGFSAMGAALALHRWFTAPDTQTMRKWTIHLIPLLVALALSASRSAWLAFAVTALITTPYRQIEKKRLQQAAVGGGLVLVAMMLLEPASTIGRVTSTFGDADAGGNLRLWFWAGAFLMWKDHRLLGVNPGQFQFHSPRYQGDALREWPPGTFEFNELHTFHAHSDYLELIAERGMGGIILIGCVAWLIKSATSNQVRPGLIAMAIFSILNTTLHSTPHLMAGMLLILTGIDNNDSGIASRWSFHIKRWFLVAVGFFAGVIHCALIINPSHGLQKARNLYGAEEMTKALQSYKKNAGLMWMASPYAHMELAVLYMDQHDLDKARNLARNALNRLDTGEIHYLAGEIAYRQGEKALAAEHFKTCTHRWPGYVPAWKRTLELTEKEERGSVLAEAKPFLTAEEYAELESYDPEASPR